MGTLLIQQELQGDTNSEFQKRAIMKLYILILLLGLTVAVYSDVSKDFDLELEDEDAAETDDVADEGLNDEATADVKYWRIRRRSIRGRRIIRRVTDFCKKNPSACIGAAGQLGKR